MKCGFKWADGWSPEHECEKSENHNGDHMCGCDARLSHWMGTHGLPHLADDEEEARLALRKELERQQQQDVT